MDRKAQNNQMITKEQRVISVPAKRLYSLKEAAHYLGRSVWGMRELIWAGKIPVVRERGSRKIFLDVRDLDDFIARNKSRYV